MVIYNYYRWFPNGVIAFVAPTKPLVDQQSKAVQRLVGLSANDVVAMVGTAKNDRVRHWMTKRVIFTTPQAFESDVNTGTVPDGTRICPAPHGRRPPPTSSSPSPSIPLSLPSLPPDRLCLLVVDECHRAKGGNAPVKAIQHLSRAGRNQGLFRVLGLSATPGSTIQDIQEVIT